MIKTAFQKGARDAFDRFGVREASLLDLIMGIGTPMAAKAGLNVLAPKLMPTVEKSLETPFRALKSVGTSAVRALRAPSAEDVLVRGLSGSPGAGTLRNPAAMIARLGGE